MAKKKSASRKNNKLEFSKIIFIALYVQYISVVITCEVIMFLYQTTDYVTQLIISSAALFTIAVSWYYNKAMAENKLKIRRDAMKYKVKYEGLYSDDDISQTLNELNNSSDTYEG